VLSYIAPSYHSSPSVNAPGSCGYARTISAAFVATPVGAAAWTDVAVSRAAAADSSRGAAQPSATATPAAARPTTRRRAVTERDSRRGWLDTCRTTMRLGPADYSVGALFNA
jgi:hypothetical protein